MNGSDEAVGSLVAAALPREEQIRATEQISGYLAGNSLSENGLHISKHASLEYFGERRCSSSHANEDLLITECIEPVNLASMDLRTSADPRGDISEKSSEMKSSASLMLSNFQSFSKALPSFTAILQCSNPSVCRFSLRYPSHGVCLAKAGLQVHI
ncbi:unnamed protein product [Fraxinus pennsylvanica]|uniref:Uncharacterized protein n=1 Tax=Fraxinus pennsylvanica TaxID=56036 RepID=A0AAD1Z157_9LAMI|nr:unnamed protein product [Fraxinus pennsylvanica]